MKEPVLWGMKISWYSDNLIDAFREAWNGDWEEARYHMDKALDIVTTPYYMVKYGIQNLIDYFPVIWGDRDWDYTFALSLLKKKLERMEHLQIHHAHHVDHMTDAAEIRVCIDLIDKILEDDFCREEHDAHTLKYGELKMETKPEFIDSDGKIRTYSCVFSRSNPDYPEEEERVARLELYNLEEKRRNEAYHELFITLKDKLRGWWD
jgi:hypothetical protein